MIINNPTCWCGNANLLPFGPDYLECKDCSTLISKKGIFPEQCQVRDDETDFYGKKYWLEHQRNDLGHPDIHDRSRNDLTERNLHWLKTLLKYCLPPARTLELGCSHGSFVALLQQAGYDASGMEMSPWIVEFGKNTFQVPIVVGPIESLEIPPASLDIIILMDVLEHLSDPAATMAHCLQLLKPNGLLFIQTPQFKKEMDYVTLYKGQHPFLLQLKADEHLYLFSSTSVTRMFQQMGANHIQFEPAFFDHYDMFFTVSRTPLPYLSPEQINSALTRTPPQRFVQALLTLYDREQELKQKLVESENDRAARLEQISTLTALLQESESDRAARLGHMQNLTTMVHEQTAKVRSLEAEKLELTAQLNDSKTDYQDLNANPLIKIGRKAGLIPATKAQAFQQWENQPTIFHITHWKAGSQWLYKILQELASDRIIRPLLYEKHFLEKPLIQGAIYPTVYITKEQFQSVTLPENYKKFIIIRDLRDTLISGYFSMRYSHPVLESSGPQLRSRLEAMTVEEGLLVIMREWLPGCARIQESWIGNDDRIIRYEDLLKNDTEILEELFIDHCKIPITAKKLSKIIVANHFENISGGRKRGEEDIMKHNRKGISGDWKNYFTRAVNQQFNELYGNLLINAGYEVSDPHIASSDE